MPKTILVSALLLLTVALFSLFGCREKEAHAEASTENRQSSKKNTTSPDASNDRPKMTKPVNVKVRTVRPSNLTQYIIANGTTRALRELTYSAEVPGRIEALNVDIGDRVRKGQVLARIDFTTLKAQSDQAKTSYNLAQSTYERLSVLEGEDIISKQRIDEARSRMENEKSGLFIAEANVKKAIVRSTYPGIVGAKFAEKGEYAAPGTPLFKVVDYKTIIVEARLAETQAPKIDRNAAVDVEIEALGKTFKGTVDTLIPAADRESRTFTLRIKVDNSDYDILIGMSATVRIASGQLTDMLVVPQHAVIEEQNEKSVFIVENGKAVKKSVRLGARQGDKATVIEGLASGDRLVVVGRGYLEDGAPVRIVK